jgi:hypothetical protein
MRTSPPQDPSMHDLLCLLQTSCLNHPKLGDTILRDFFQGAIVPADLPPEEFARFTDYVFWHVKQRGIKDPAAWLACHRARQEEEKQKKAAIAQAAAIEWEALVETGGDVPIKHNDPVSSETLPEHLTATLSPSEISKDKIAIGDDLYVSFAYLASILDISERTLSRRCAKGNGPPRVKIGGSYFYRLDKIPEWAAASGLRLKTPSDNQ